MAVDWGAIAQAGAATLGAGLSLYSMNQSKSLTREGWRLQQAENEKNRQYMSDEWTRQFEAQNAYNDPSAEVERLVRAGINPSQVFGNGTNTTAMSQGSPQASAGSSIPISSPLPVNLSGSAVIQDIAGAVKALADAERTRKLMPGEARNLDSLNRQMTQETNKIVEETKGQRLANGLTQAFGSALKSAELQKLQADILTSRANYDVLIEQKDYVKAQAQLVEFEKAYKASLKDLNEAQSARVKLLMEPEYNRMLSEVTQLYAQANYYNQSAMTENALRPYRERLAKFESEISRFESVIKEKDAAIKIWSYENEFVSLLDKYDLPGLEKEKLRADTEKAFAERDMTRLQMILQTLRTYAENARDISQGVRNMIEPATNLVPK